jgi:hypothetical protein
MRHKYSVNGRFWYEMALIPGALLDIVINWTIGGIWGYTWDLTFSQKLKKINRNPRYGWEWQRRSAKAICRELNKWAPGHEHC